MCGINGFVSYNSSIDEEGIYSTVKRMNNAIVHRGPDSEGIFSEKNMGMGMRRLSIIDVEGGKQPIFNEDHSLVIVYNGELYNYKELKQLLEKKGHIFSTNSDAEVVLHSFEEYGGDCLERFEGMFAFAIYNRNTQSFFIARDRIGEKPLYYYNDRKSFFFASELKSILTVADFSKKIDRVALSQFFQFTYIPAPLSIFENVFKLMAGMYMTVDCHGNIDIKQYWDANAGKGIICEDYETCKRIVREKVFAAVEKRMVSDVEIGAFLSGGIDSSIVVAVMSQLSSKSVNTFTIGYKNKAYDESGRAQLVADKYKTNHHVLYLDYDAVLPELDKIIGNIDEPFADSSLIPTYMVSKFASDYVKVVLTGDAGDEVFGGYEKYLIGYYSALYNKVPGAVRNSIIPKLMPMLPTNISLTRKIRKVVDNSALDIFEQRLNLMRLGFKEDELANLFVGDLNLEDSVRPVKEHYERFKSNAEEMTRAQYTDLKFVLEGDMFAKVDRASMLTSLETRAPLVDSAVIDFAFQLPDKFKIEKREKKKVFRDAFRDLIPEKLFSASKKGFGVPIGDWLMGPLNGRLIKKMDPDYLEQQGIFNSRYINRIYQEHLNKKRNRATELWTFFVFQQWYERWFKN